MVRFFDYIYIIFTIVLTVYGQLAIKWRVASVGVLPAGVFEKITFLFGLVFDPIVFSGLLAAFLASFAWIAAMTKFPLSHAYPFMSLNFVVVIGLSGLLFDDDISLQKILGVALIVIGTVVAARG